MKNFRTLSNVLILSLCQAIGGTERIIIFSVSALAASVMISDPVWITVPLTIQFLIATLITFPASLFMERFGRKIGFMFSSLVSAIGGGIGVVAIQNDNFYLFCIGSGLVGVMLGFAPYYRFAAVDVAEVKYKNQAMSFVLAGGIIAAFVGPVLADLSVDFLEVIYAGNYLLICFLPFLTVGLLSFIKIPPSIQADTKPIRKIREIATQPVFLLAAGSGMLSYSIMAILMIAAPISMKDQAISFSGITFMIQGHVLGMFIPSLFTGSLITRFGTSKILILGVIFNLVSIVVNLSGYNLVHYWVGMTLVGIGWNFMYLAASSLLTETYQESEKALVQGINEFLILLTVTFSSLSSGLILGWFGWKVLNLFVGVLLFPLLLVGIWLLFRHNRITKKICG